MHTEAFWYELPADIGSRLELSKGELGGGLSGLAYILGNIACLWVMCDPRDIRTFYQQKAPVKEKPSLYLYDNYPGGGGFAEKIFKLQNIIWLEAKKLIERCLCEQGCPSCVVPTLAARESKSRAQVKLKENKSSEIFKKETKSPQSLSSPFYDTAGYTYYDLQAPDRLQREIAIDSLGIVHAVWIKGLDSNSSTVGPREVYYSSWSADGSRLAHEVQVSELGARGGYPSIAVLPDGRAVSVYHHINTLSGGRNDGLYASVEQTPGLGDFTGEIHLPDSVDGMGDAALWPSSAAQMVDDSAVIHVVGVEGQNASGNRDFIYTRGVQGPPDTFTFSPAQRPDSSNVISVIVVASRKSNKVAIVYPRQKSFEGPAADDNIFYIESTDAGRDWVNSL